MLPAELDDLRQQVRNLADRVARLEASLAVRTDSSLTHDMGAPHSLPAPVTEQGDTPFQVPETAAFLPILGIATLGFAGAYFLRAIAESGVLPARFVFALATLYAVGWLLWAARVPVERRLATTLYSLTAALILCPLLWEATVRFHTVTPGQTSVILLAFTLIGLAVSWQRDLLVVATISTLTAIGTAGALLIATYDVLPFTFFFLAVAAAIETCACLNHWLGERWFVAAAADLAVFLATWLVTNPRGLPQGYAPIPATALFVAQMTLVVIYISSVVVRTFLRGRSFTNFETVQCALAFIIGLGGALRLSAEGSALTPAIAGLALLCGAACYAIAFEVLARQASQGRNFYTYSTFGILLVVVGCRILLNDGAAALAWSLLALACIGAGGLWVKLTLLMHGAAYLLLALMLSGALRASAGFLLGADPWPGVAPAALWMGVAVAGASYVLAMRSATAIDKGWNFRAFRLTVAAVMVWEVLGLLAGGLTGILHGLAGLAPGDPYCATLRTAAVAGAALLLAWASSRPSFRELAPMVYPLMLLGAYRLMAVDMRQDRKTALFLSLLFYGAALVAIPRVRRAKPTTEQA